ncbi:hypothetical protein [Maribacter sp. 2308TA10-17]|uniref:hypothetical protein n=1 Tax=Maribacter sp. 2308TA10-17 TaxID=3386276 RepID=UPI0039BD51DE
MKKQEYLNQTKAVILSVLAILCMTSIVAQELDHDAFSVTENIPKSPEASSLGQYGDIAANPYNGKANISVPIYNLNFEGLQIPIQLSYDSGGVKTMAEASWVGLNWSLSTNFGISRQVNALDDLRFGLGYVYTNYEVNPNIGTGGNPNIAYDDILDIHASFQPDAGPSQQIDMQPDIFDVNLFGMSYKFRLKKKGPSSIIEAHVFDNNNVQIEFDLNNETFTIIDERGFIYEFLTKDYSTTFFTDGPGSGDKAVALTNILGDVNKANESLITSWYLDKITSPNQRVLNFDYTAGAYFTFPSYSGTVRVVDANNVTFVNSNGEDTTAPGIEGEIYSASTTIVENNYLNRIYGDFGEVNFVLSGRDDLLSGFTFQNTIGASNFVFSTSSGLYSTCQGDVNCVPSAGYINRFSQKLDRIEVVNSSNNTVLNADFTYSYFNADDQNTIDKEKYIRLKLDQVSVNDQNYLFDYEQPNELPAKDTFDSDFWGYYNGSGNTKNVPRIGRFITSEISINGLTHIGQSYINYDAGADKGPDFGYGKFGLLNRIVYPTGGYTFLCYEPHEAVITAPQPYIVTSDFSFVGVDRYKWTNLTDESNYHFDYQYLKKAQNSNYNFFNNQFDPGQIDTETPIQLGQTFTVTSTSMIRASGTLELITNADFDGNYINEPARVIQNTITSEDVSVIYRYGDWPVSQTGGTQLTKDNSVIIGPGTYRIAGRNAVPKPNVNTPPSIRIIEESDPDPVSTPYTLVTFLNGTSLGASAETFEIGGARVASITNYESDNSFLSRKVFEYNNPNASNTAVASSGILMDDLIYFSKAYGFHSYNPLGWGTSPLQLSSSSPLRTNPAAQGSHVGYTYTTEKSVDESFNDIGRIERTFTNRNNEYYVDSFARDYRNGACTRPDDYTARITNTYLLGMDSRINSGYENGNVEFENIFDTNNNLVRSTENSYANLIANPDDTYFATFMHIYLISNDTGCGGIPFGSDDSSYVVYRQPISYSLKSVLNTSTIVDYRDENISTTQMTTYNPDTHHVTESKVIDSRGDELLTRQFYPYDTEVDTQAEMTTLVNENRIASPVRTESFRQSEMLSTQVINFKKDATTFDIVQPNSVDFIKGTLNASNTLETRIEYQEYGPHGQIRQYKKAGGPPTTLVWGHNEQFVVAKIENATYDDVEALAEFGSGFTLGNNGLNANQAASLRTNLSGAMVTTYTHDPLIGITSMTDPRDYTIKYIYDDATRRLKEVRDQEDNLVTDYEYEFVDVSIQN